MLSISYFFLFFPQRLPPWYVMLKVCLPCTIGLVKEPELLKAMYSTKAEAKWIRVRGSPNRSCCLFCLEVELSFAFNDQNLKALLLWLVVMMLVLILFFRVGGQSTSQPCSSSPRCGNIATSNGKEPEPEESSKQRRRALCYFPYRGRPVFFL